MKPRDFKGHGQWRVRSVLLSLDTQNGSYRATDVGDEWMVYSAKEPFLETVGYFQTLAEAESAIAKHESTEVSHA